MFKFNIRYLFVCAFIIAVLCIILNTSLSGYKTHNHQIHGFKSHDILSISPSCDSFDDLYFLKERLVNKSIVILGESRHSDGSTFLAKTRLVKFLHKELGFDVIAFESGRFDMYRFHENKDLSLDMVTHKFWSDAVQMQELWSYVRHKNLNVKGFDIQLTGSISDSARRDLIFDYLEKYEPNARQLWHDFYHAAGLISSYLNNPYYNVQLRDIDREKYLQDIESIIDFLSKENQSESNIEYIHMLLGIKQWWECINKYELGNTMRFEIRDSLMAENITDIINSNSDKKVIIWISNLHALKYNHQYYDKDISFKNTGEIIEERFHQATFTILFSSFCQMSEDGNIFGFARSNSIEYYLHNEKMRYAILTDFVDGHNTDIATGINQGIFYTLNLAKSTDAIFFIDTMRCVSY